MLGSYFPKCKYAPKCAPCESWADPKWCRIFPGAISTENSQLQIPKTVGKVDGLELQLQKTRTQRVHGRIIGTQYKFTYSKKL